MKNIAIFASGSGTNAQRIADYFNDSEQIAINRIYSNNPKAFVLERARKLNIPITVFSRHEFYHTSEIVELLQQENTDLIVLAGFLWLIPKNLISAFPRKIINIHPALLPKYGGKGMYGKHVHEAVIHAGEDTSGITIHYVNENYDEGEVIFRATCNIAPSETPDSLAAKIHELEYKHFPVVIANLLKAQNDQPHD